MKTPRIGLFAPQGVAAFLFVAAVLLAPDRALATVDSTYTPDRCLGADQPTNNLFVGKDAAGNDNTRNRTATRLYNPTASPITVVCPIVKRASGPGIQGDDYVASIDIGATPAGGTLRCTMNIWRSRVVRDGVSANRVFNHSVSSSSLTPVTMTLQPTFSITSFWSDYQAEMIPPDWEYVDLQCEVPAFASLGPYTVHENGTMQTPRIYPPSNCRPETTSNTGPWRYLTMNPDSDQLDNGGMLYFAAEGQTTFAFHCPLPNNMSVEFAVLPSAFGANGDQVIGCNLDTLPFSGVTWAAVSSSSSSAPYQVLPLANQPSILTPPTGTHELVCGQKNGGTGDGSLIAYRAIPPMPRNSPSAWTATASRSDGQDVPGRALDGDTASRWTDGIAQSDAVPQYFQVDMKSSRTLRQIVMNANNSTDYPRAFKVYVSTTNNWTGVAPVYAGVGKSSVVSARFAEVTGRYIRVVLTPTANVSSWWSIKDFNVYQ